MTVLTQLAQGLTGILVTMLSSVAVTYASSEGSFVVTATRVADVSGNGPVCSETLEYMHDRLRHPIDDLLDDGPSVLMGANGGYSKSIPEMLQEKREYGFGPEQVIQATEESIKLRSQRIAGPVPPGWTRPKSTEQREAFEDSIKGQEELIKVIRCWQQPGARSDNAPSRKKEIHAIREAAYSERLCRLSPLSCASPSASTSPRNAQRPKSEAGPAPNPYGDSLGGRGTGATH